MRVHSRIAIVLAIVVTASCGACYDLPTPSPNVYVVDAEGTAVDALVLHLVAPDGESTPFEGSRGGYYAVYGRELPAGTYTVVLDSEEFVISGSDELVVRQGGRCDSNTGQSTITVMPVSTR